MRNLTRSPTLEGILWVWDHLTPEKIASMSRGEMLYLLRHIDPNGEWSDLDPDVSDEDIRDEMLRMWRD